MNKTMQVANTTDPAIIGDIGGTNARFAIAHNKQIKHVKIFRTKDHPNFKNALLEYQMYLQEVQVSYSRAVFAVAGPIEENSVDFTNSDWTLHLHELEQQLQCALTLMNDFAAQALALRAPELQLQALHIPDDSNEFMSESRINNTKNNTVRLIVGPGTGLGVAYSHGDQIIATEAGHITLASRNAQEFKIYQFLQYQSAHVSAERVCSGPGLEGLYHYFSGQQKSAKAIFEASQNAPDSFEHQAIQQFLSYFGAISGQLALSVNAQAGVYLAGGLSRRFAELFASSDFLESFCDKGRFSDYMARIPVWIVTEPEPALLGLAHWLHQ